MPTYRAMAGAADATLAPVDKELLDPEPGQVRIRVEACGIPYGRAAAKPPSLQEKSGEQP